MSSAADRDVKAEVNPEMTALAPDDRIIVRENEYGYSIEYRDPNPETRYLPRQQSAWEAIKEMWRLGGKPVLAFRIR